ncbi:NADPH-dependent FMN reductase [Marinomonas atlantica]|uniref:NADPH-dependent FMN reductase n=1 Tax=Marinomonas atlantica TaxID=1806668 RepID=UPI0008334283|nr:NADPH-dependent FMN reductase [Marinomonas atlantica]
MKLLAISGSPRQASTNTALLNAIKRRAPLGADFFVFNQLNTLPVFSPDLEGDAMPQVMRKFIDQVALADGIIISSPEYIRAIPGGLKNAIDWMVSRYEVVGKPIALVHASHRDDDMLVSLRLVLRTVSEHFQEDNFLRIPLIGKTPEEVEAVIQTSNYEVDISKFLADFMARIEEIKQK